MKNEIIEWLKALGFAIVIVFVINIFIGTTTVYNTSMFPTLHEKDMALLIKVGDIEAGDIVSFKSDIPINDGDVEQLNFIQKLFINDNSTKNLIKRVIGVPGDEVLVADGEVYVNGELLDESYVSSYTSGEAYYEEIPEGFYFAMGDNRKVSLDSRSSSVGLVSEEDVIGKAIFRIFPFSGFGSIE